MNTVLSFENGGIHMKKPIVEYASSGPSGNIYYILGKAKTALRKQRRITDYNEMWERVQDSGNYKAALEVIGEYVELVDTNAL
jgi:hypothetical protein